ncbi:MAG: hypothetical protein KF777_15715 [Planctomycetaceae bacterium]|nr:hypothetical protein [Planctomycetaceae bacterium]
MFECPMEVGKSYFIRTLTMNWTGRVAKIVGTFVVLDEAAWIADSDRYSEALAGPIDRLTHTEIEPSPRPVGVNLTSVIDFVEYPFALPRVAK